MGTRWTTGQYWSKEECMHVSGSSWSTHHWQTTLSLLIQPVGGCPCCGRSVPSVLVCSWGSIIVGAWEETVFLSSKWVWAASMPSSRAAHPPPFRLLPAQVLDPQPLTQGPQPQDCSQGLSPVFPWLIPEAEPCPEQNLLPVLFAEGSSSHAHPVASSQHAQHYVSWSTHVEMQSGFTNFCSFCKICSTSSSSPTITCEPP